MVEPNELFGPGTVASDMLLEQVEDLEVSGLPGLCCLVDFFRKLVTGLLGLSCQRGCVA